jgi:hypothetical protein
MTPLWGRFSGAPSGSGLPLAPGMPVRYVGQLILAAAGFQPALFTCAPVGFRRQRQSPTRVNASSLPTRPLP